MSRSTFNTQRSRKSALELREMAMAIGQQLRIECELPKKPSPELATLLIRADKKHDPYEDIVGTC